MSIAEDLRRDADDALNGGGMYYSGEYLSDITKKVEAIVAENEKLRELVTEQRRLAQMRLTNAVNAYWAGSKTPEQFDALMKVTARVNRLSEELGIEVD